MININTLVADNIKQIYIDDKSYKTYYYEYKIIITHNITKLINTNIKKLVTNQIKHIDDKSYTIDEKLHVYKSMTNHI